MRLLFFATGEFALPSLERLKREGFDIQAVISAPRKPKGRGLKPIPSPVSIKAKELGLPLIETPEPNSEASIQEFKGYKPDYGIVIDYRFILKTPLLSLFRYGCIGVHPSLLPLYRGAAPIQRSIMEGATKTGVSVFLMDEGIDSGPILLQKETEIKPEETFGELRTRLSLIGAELLCDALKGIESLKPIPQDDSRATYAHKLQKEERLIDWKKPAKDIVNLIRALSPTPLAYTRFREKRVEIYQARERDIMGTPGLIIPERGSLVIGALKGGVEVLRLKVEGRSIISGRDFINGYRPKQEEHFY